MAVTREKEGRCLDVGALHVCSCPPAALLCIPCSSKALLMWRPDGLTCQAVPWSSSGQDLSELCECQHCIQCPQELLDPGCPLFTSPQLLFSNVPSQQSTAHQQKPHTTKIQCWRRPLNVLQLRILAVPSRANFKGVR